MSAIACEKSAVQNNNVALTKIDADSVFIVTDNKHPARFRSLRIDFHIEIHKWNTKMPEMQGKTHSES